jgi:hypothetical protein
LFFKTLCALISLSTWSKKLAENVHWHNVMVKRKMQNNILKRKTKRKYILQKMVRQSAAVIFTAG